MAAVTIQHINKSYVGQTVIENISLSLNKGEKVGLIGANGSGKTTLFKLIVGIEAPDSGTVTVTRGIKIGYLPQEPDLPDDATMIEAVGEVFREHRKIEADLQDLTHQIAESYGQPAEQTLLDKYDKLHARFEARGGYSHEIKMREVLGGLGFSPDDYHRPIKILSGGQKCRTALARMLLEEADLLLLDEPTNHLDIDATQWLEKYLAAHHGGAVIISHDRYLLDRVVTKIIEIEDHRTTVYPTDYSGYAQAKRMRQLHAVREYEKQSTWIAHQRDYINRARYKKDSAKQARARQKYLDRMESGGKILHKPTQSTSKMKIQFRQDEQGGDMVVRCEGAAKGFGEIELIKNLDLEMTKGEKIGIIGPNGVGKTTLLRMLLGQLEPDAGEVRLYENLTVGYYDQEHRDLNPSHTAIEAVREIRPDANEAESRSYLALFLFRGDDVFKRVGDLSGGEQSRILLARLVWMSPQVLVLDEPTNHLDILSREALEYALGLFPGSILIVSHDRYFLDRTVDRLLVLPKRGQHELVPGNWSTYSEILSQRTEKARIDLARLKTEAQKGPSTPQSKGRKRKSRSKYLVQRIGKLEDAIISCESKIEELEISFADPAAMRDPTTSKRLHDDYQALKEHLSKLNKEWEEAVDAQIE